ncbi:hypothetical protein [Polaromonas sp.]|uniref:hypothetical protein n=1 Tax=Polaromonas sp. TaxID=1869339 RepID=UPI00352B6873
MKTNSLLYTALLASIVVIAGCGRPQDEIATPRFDAKLIAAETDKGNLAPLAELNKACTEEIAAKGKRMEVCAIQDQVGKLTKPVSVGF